MSTSLSSEQIATALYRSILGREPDPAGLAGVIEALCSGQPLEQIIRNMMGSVEFCSFVPEQIATALYRGILEREPDPTGLAGAIEALRSGHPIESMARDFIASSEFRSRVGPLTPPDPLPVMAELLPHLYERDRANGSGATALVARSDADAGPVRQAQPIDPSLHPAAIELKAADRSDQNLLSEDGEALTNFEGQHELALLLATLRDSGAPGYELLISSPVFAKSGKSAAEPEKSADPPDDQLAIVPGPLRVETRANSAIFSELDPAYADEDIPLTRHMVHTWRRFGKPQFHLNSDRNRLAFIVWYYQSHRQPLASGVGTLPLKLVTALNSPAPAHGPLTRFLFGMWQSEYCGRDEFDVQREAGYVNFLTEVTARPISRHFPDELLPKVLLTAIHQPAIGDPPHQLDKAAHSIWRRSEASRTKYRRIDDWRVRQAFNFDLIIHVLGTNPNSRLISPDAIRFWSGPISPEFPGLSRFAASLAHLSGRFEGAARSPMEIAQNADAIVGWFRHAVVRQLPQFGVFSTTPVIPHAPWNKPNSSCFALRSELRQFGIDHFPGDCAEEIDLLVIGPVAAQSGLGSGTRRSIGALERTHCNFRVLDFSYGNPSVMAKERHERAYRGENPKAVLWHFNAESLQECMHILRIFTAGRYNIGYFFWETEAMPLAHQLSVDMVDEIWTPSEFAAKCYSATNVPVVNVGTSVQLPKFEKFLGREYFGFEDEFVFLFSFDGHSTIHRKNPRAVVRAFLKAFHNKMDQVRLVIKTQNLLQTQENWGLINGRNEELFELCSKDHRIELIDRTMTLTEYYSLKTACDCYVSLHHSEGFGYGPAEAMALGKPVIMTNYSANVEFATPDNCLLVDVELVPIQEDEYLYWVPEMKWAEVDIDHAAAHMRRVFEDRAFAAKLGQRAKESINREFGQCAIARRYGKRLTELGLNGNVGEMALSDITQPRGKT